MRRAEAMEAKLRRYMEAYGCGEEPNPTEMLRAPVIRNWRTVVERLGPHNFMQIIGVVEGHTSIADGPIRTSTLVWLDRKLRFARTQNTLYALHESRELPIGIDGVNL